jgi:hypothetical protein
MIPLINGPCTAVNTSRVKRSYHELQTFADDVEAWINQLHHPKPVGTASVFLNVI